MSMSITGVTTVAPSFDSLYKIPRDEAFKKIESAKKKALERAQELIGEDRIILEGRINALAQDLKDSLDKFGSSGIFDSEQMCRTADESAQRLNELSENSVTNIQNYEKEKNEAARKSSAFRSAMGSSSIDFHSFVPSPSEAGVLAVTAGLGASLGRMAATNQAKQGYVSALEKLVEAGKAHHIQSREHAALNIAVVRAKQGVKYVTEDAHRNLKGKKGFERRLEKTIAPMREAVEDLKVRRNVTGHDRSITKQALSDASKEAHAAKPVGRRWKGGVKGAIVAVVVEKVIEKVVEAFESSKE